MDSGLIDDAVYWNDLRDRWEGPDAAKGKNRIVTGAKYAGRHAGLGRAARQDQGGDHPRPGRDRRRQVGHEPRCSAAP